jgi:hypothetical protein
MAILKAAGGDGDAHGHPDQLGLQFFGAGGRIAIDPGTPGYGIALNDTWYRQTAGHSTVLLDAASQPPAVASIDRFEPDAAEASVRWPSFDEWWAVAERTSAIQWPQEPSPAYAEVSMRREVRLDGGTLTDDFEVEAPAERTIDWLLHVRGTFTGPADPATGALEGPCGYDELTDVRRIDAGAATLSFDLPAGRLAIGLEQLPGEKRYLASAPGNPAAHRHLLLVRRVVASRVNFRSVLRIAAAGESRPILPDGHPRSARRGGAVGATTESLLATPDVDESV